METVAAAKWGMALAQKNSTLSVVILSSLYIGGLALLAQSVVSAWLGFDDLNRAVDDELRVEAVEDEIKQLREDTRVSAELAVTTGAPRWNEKYARDATRLKATLKQAKVLGSSESHTASIDRVDTANGELMALEAEAMRLAGQGRNEKALAVLASANFWKWNEIFETRIQKVMSESQGVLKAARGELRDRLRFLIGAAAAIVATLLSIFAVAFLKMRNQAAALAASNALLETRVRERTASLDLSITHKSLNQFASRRRNFLESNESLMIHC